MQSTVKKHIVVVGSLNIDLVVTAPRHPEIGETIIGSEFHTFPGGKGANQSVAAARLGGSVNLVGRVGADAFGEMLIESIAANGVKGTHVQRDPASATGVALITVGAGGDNSIVAVQGANGRVTPEDVEQAESVFENASVLLLQFEIPMPAIEKAIQVARKHGVQVILNPAPACDIHSELLVGVDYLIPNRTELAFLTGMDSIDAGVDMLHDLGVKNLIVTLGEDGAILANAEKRVHLPAFRVQAVDTTAAGDAFVGAFAVALNEGLALEQAVVWGNAAGALAATKPGAQPSLPTRAELAAFLQTHSNTH